MLRLFAGSLCPAKCSSDVCMNSYLHNTFLAVCLAKMISTQHRWSWDHSIRMLLQGDQPFVLGVAWGWLILKSKFQLNCWGFTNILSKWAPEDDQGWVSMHLCCGMRHLNSWSSVRGTVWERVALWEGMCRWAWALRCQRLSVSCVFLHLELVDQDVSTQPLLWHQVCLPHSLLWEPETRSF